MDQDLIKSYVNGIASTSKTITLHIPTAQEVLTIHHELDDQHRFHTHVYVSAQSGNPDVLPFFRYGFYRHPDGGVIGPIFRD
jgi:hypothetical protein